MTTPPPVEIAAMARFGVVWNGTEYEEKRVEMTNEQTRALIAEARHEESIQDKLGDGFSEGSDERAFYYGHRDRYKRLADALEAATREPSGDGREVTEAEIDKAARALHMAKCCSLSGDSPHDFPEASELFAAGVVLNAVPRAAVPDAATEELANAKAGWDSALRIVNESNDIIKTIGAERDAALAAIERLNARHRKVEASAVTGDCAIEECEHEDECPTEVFEVCAACWNLCESADQYFGERGIAPVLWPCEIATALDGAPEPEWEYGLRRTVPNEPGTPWNAHTISDNLDGVTAWRSPYDEVVRRRPAGPWEILQGVGETA